MILFNNSFDCLNSTANGFSMNKDKFLSIASEIGIKCAVSFVAIITAFSSERDSNSDASLVTKSA